MGSNGHHLPSSQQTSVSLAFVGIFFHAVPPELYIQISYSSILTVVINDKHSLHSVH
jgi:hypothetical protein